MAREMNVDKRMGTLQSILTKTEKHSVRAKKIALELRTSFAQDDSKRGKNARKLANAAKKISTALQRAVSSSAV